MAGLASRRSPSIGARGLRAPAATPRSRSAELRVVAGGRSSTKRPHRTGIAMVSLGVLVSAALLGVVVTHVALTQNQFRLDSLDGRVASQAAEQQRLRLQVAELESPSRIVQVAEQKLGMVVPSSVTYLEPVPAPSRQRVSDRSGARGHPAPDGRASDRGGGTGEPSTGANGRTASVQSAGSGGDRAGRR